VADERCRWCAEPLVVVAGKCRDCGEVVARDRPAGELRWDEERLVVPPNVVWPRDRCLRCDRREGVALGARTVGNRTTALPLCRRCEASERGLSRAILVAWTLAVCVPGGLFFYAAEAEVPQAMPAALLIGLGCLCIAGIATTSWNKQRIRVTRTEKDTVWLAFPDPAATRRALAPEPPADATPPAPEPPAPEPPRVG
jgi:hypothetical protein